MPYETMVRSAMEYAKAAWFPSAKELVNKPEVTKRKALGFIYNKYRLTNSARELLKQVRIFTLENRVKLAWFKLCTNSFTNNSN